MFLEVFCSRLQEHSSADPGLSDHERMQLIMGCTQVRVKGEDTPSWRQLHIDSLGSEPGFERAPGRTLLLSALATSAHPSMMRGGATSTSGAKNPFQNFIAMPRTFFVSSARERTAFTLFENGNEFVCGVEGAATENSSFP